MKFIAKTLYGLEAILADELKRLGAIDVRTANRAVLFQGDKEVLYRVNYCSRIALSILMAVSEFRIRSKDDLYSGGLKVEWDRYMDTDSTFSVSPVVNSPYFTHTGYPGLILKDSIADYFSKKSGRRPSVNTNDPSVVVNLHIRNDLATISLDSSVIPLFKRGYRTEPAEAPLNEVLAAGIIHLSGWNASASLTDPMCGSGTIPIEAGLIACNIPPGKFRSYFGFQKWNDFDELLFEKVKHDNDVNIRPAPVKIFCSDISDRAVNQTRENVLKAGLTDTVSVSLADFRNTRSYDNNGYLFLNPPYGQRLKPVEIDNLYSMIGTTLKHNFTGDTAWLITSNMDSLKHVGLKAKRKIILFNSALECRLLKYEMYAGSNKKKPL
jgi:putative N6-adenine-specific DNA methylase